MMKQLQACQESATEENDSAFRPLCRSEGEDDAVGCGTSSWICGQSDTAASPEHRGGAQPSGEVPSTQLDQWDLGDVPEPLLETPKSLSICSCPSTSLLGVHLPDGPTPLDSTPQTQEPSSSQSPVPPQGLPSLEGAACQSLSLILPCREEGEQAPSDGAGVVASCCIEAEEGSGGEDECPICTEPYDGTRHKQALLNCNHVLCNNCLNAIMEAADAAEIGRVRCPICRQKTPMLEWEICKLQEEMLLLHTQPSSPLPLAVPHTLPVRQPGLWGALEHHFQVRFHTGRMVGCLPCVRYPLCLIRRLGHLEQRCRCCYLLALMMLLLAEMLSLLLVFLPIVLLVLLFLILDK
ncbi:ring finger protein-like [Alligator mississippiensis]|uniref:ring finger protein-like n=1 Tax=Alligator mississippiensis TaxID=8496 RepID=UPI0006EC9F42|nr:ring finger protein-like [Alligator mississippiensis]